MYVDTLYGRQHENRKLSAFHNLFHYFQDFVIDVVIIIVDLSLVLLVAFTLELQGLESVLEVMEEVPFMAKSNEPHAQ